MATPSGPKSWGAAKEHGILPIFYLELTTGLCRGEITALLSAGFTLDAYAHVTGTMQKEAADKVGGFIAKAV